MFTCSFPLPIPFWVLFPELVVNPLAAILLFIFMSEMSFTFFPPKEILPMYRGIQADSFFF